MSKWDERFLHKAEVAASWSKDSTKVGAVIYDSNRRPVSEGYNGLPMGVSDNSELYADKDRVVIHAEVNAILFADREKLKGSTIYITRPPCAFCAALIIQSGISRVVFKDTPLKPKWEHHKQIALAMFSEALISTVWIT